MDLILWRHADAENASPDSARRLTEGGRDQARRVAAWLRPRLPGDYRVLVSPATRAQQTAATLGTPFVTSAALGTDADAADVLAAANWPERPGTTVIVGHQPTLGRIAAVLLSGRRSDWNIDKGALWWLRGEHGTVTLRAAIDPGLV